MPVLLITFLLVGASPGSRSWSPAPQRLQLLGTVGALPVRMTLRLEGRVASAEYAYATGPANIPLTGRLAGPDGALNLTTSPPDAAESFAGTFDASTGRFEGTWKKGARSLPFALRVFARQVALGGAGRCASAWVLRFELDDAALAQVLSSRAKALAQEAVSRECDPGMDGFKAEQVLWAMHDGLVSVRTFTGDGLSRSSGSTSVVLDTRTTPPSELGLDASALDAPKLRATLAREADRALRQGDASLLPAVLAPGAEVLGPDWSGWAITPSGLQLFFRMNNWAASGDGTAWVLVRRERLKGLFRQGTRLGDWAERAEAP